MNNVQIWQSVLGELELSISKANFTTWFKNTSIISAKDGEFTVAVPNGFAKEWLEKKYHKNIYRALQNITGKRIKKINYQIISKKPGADFFVKETEIKSYEKLERTVEAEEEKFVRTDYLNPKYTFENFVVGTNNDLARAASWAVAETQGTKYNPLFIYGGVGLGKTHLIQAIGNEVKKRNHKKKIIYATCEKFIEDFINFIEKGRKQTSAFKDKYRNCDYLLIDDIQFLSGKEGTQTEFFHTFNALYQEDKQIVITSDRPPKAIVGIEDRLISRFEGGMTVDIGIPDLETRKAILDAKCKEKNITMPEEVINYIATNIQHNIRELEGALRKIIAFCQLNGIENPDERIAKKVLASLTCTFNKKALTPKKIIEAVASFYDIAYEDLIAKNRKKEVAWPRQIAMYLMRDEAKTSYPTIGQEIGGRDHTTAIHAYEKVAKEIENNENLKQEIDLLRQRLYNT